MYRHMPSWTAVGCYFEWREHYATEQRAKEGVGKRRRDGSVLTEAGWLLPSGPLNPRVIDQPGIAVMSPSDIAEQRRIDAEVDFAREEHELAVLAEDMAMFGLQWSAVFHQTKKTRRRLLAARGRSEEREAFMVRWHAANRPH